MPTHWTYTEVSPDADLMQGDILVPTEELRGILPEVHPHFLSPKYTGFLVTTQSCDMARRDGTKCSTRYLNIAVLRQLDDVLHDFLAVAVDGVGQVFETGVLARVEPGLLAVSLGDGFDQRAGRGFAGVRLGIRD